MPDVLEYVPYDKVDGHLTESEAISRYSSARREKPGALVILKDLDCGHWTVTTYETPAEVNAFLSDRLRKAIKVAVKWFDRQGKPIV